MFLSHCQPDKKLTDHLREVYLFSQQMLKQVPLADDERETLEIVNKVIALSHDFGKYLSYFQTYLRTGEKSNNLYQHSFISALFAAHLLRDAGRWGLRASWSEFAPAVAYFIVLHHHGNLRDFSLDVTKSLNIRNQNVQESLYLRIQLLEKQIGDIKNQLAEVVDDLSPLWNQVSIPLSLEEELKDFVEKYIDVFDLLHRQYYFISKQRKPKITKKLYYIVLLLYSALIDADKLSAANIQKRPRLCVPEKLVDAYREQRFNVHETEGTDGWRNRMYQVVMQRLEKLEYERPEQRIFTLTAPTGAGKTLLALSVALKWRSRTEKRDGYAPKIIYALPFTSVIDQNDQVIREVFQQLPDYPANEHRYVIKHHHLSTIQYRQENEELPLRQALLLTEDWEAEIIVTTFVQLFQTLIGYENRALKKFHQIAGSIVILDEVQNIPVEYWALVQKVLRDMAHLYSCKILLLTATQPLIFPPEETVELLEGENVKPIDFFKEKTRVELQWLRNENDFFTSEEWARFFQNRFEDGKNYLAIFNTIKTSIEVYEKVKTWLKKCGYHVFYLSTNIIPKERKGRIEDIKQSIKNQQKVAVISTQVVEAGVDLDFDVVYRDIGPIDAIIQAAGRCNRNGTRKRLGKVWITPIVRNAKLESQYVYGPIHTKIARDILPEEPITEDEFYQLIQKYFERVKESKSSAVSEGIIQAMEILKFDEKGKVSSRKQPEYVSDFQFIADSNQAVDVFIEADKEAREIWELYNQKVILEKDFKKRFDNYLSLKKDLRQYVISVPIKIAKNLNRDFYEKTKMLYVSKDVLNQYYNEEFGFIRSSEMVDAWIM